MTAKKQITIDVPDGLPDGWECFGYGYHADGQTLSHCSNGWYSTVKNPDSPCYLIARRTETAADWANKQPKLGALAGVMGERHSVTLYKGACHDLSDGIDVMDIYAEEGGRHSGLTIKAIEGKWVNA